MDSKTIIFSFITSLFVILGLAFMNVFSLNQSHIPILLVGTVVGLTFYNEISDRMGWKSFIMIMIGSVLLAVFAEPPARQLSIIIVAAVTITFILVPIFAKTRELIIKGAKKDVQSQGN